jgi:hypothetical protein
MVIFGEFKDIFSSLAIFFQKKRNCGKLLFFQNYFSQNRENSHPPKKKLWVGGGGTISNTKFCVPNKGDSKFFFYILQWRLVRGLIQHGKAFIRVVR